MPKVSDLKQSKFLTKHDCGRGVLVTIRGYEQVNVAMQGAEPEMKYVLNFNECEKGLVLNSTNGQLLEQILKSDDFDNWIGQKIVLYDEPNISFGGKLTGGIRVRAPRNQPAPAQQTQPTPPVAPKPATPAPQQMQQANEPDPDDDIPF